MKIFGSGYAFSQQTQDANGNALALGPRTILGINQSISFDMGFTVKELLGQNQWPEDVARGAMKLTGKIKFAQIFGAGLDSLFFGQPSNLLSNNLTAIQVGLAAQTVAATITVTPSSGASFAADECVINAATGVPLVPVTGAPSAGQYAVAVTTASPSLGVYTFNTADVSAGVSVFLNYLTTLATSTGAYTQSVQSLPMGSTPLFSISHTVSHLGKSLTLLFPRCTSTKLGLDLKNEDFLVPEIDFSVMRDPVTNSVLKWSTAE